MRDITARGQTSNIGFVFLVDSTTGLPKTGLTNASTGLLISVRRELSATMTAYSAANIGTIVTNGAWINPGTGKCNFKLVDDTNAPGMYELHFVDLIMGTSDASRKLVGMVQATGVLACPFEIPLTGLDLQPTPATIPVITATVNDGSPTASAFVGSNNLSTTLNFYGDSNGGCICAFTSGALAGLARKITGYTTGRQLQFAKPFPVAPTNGDSFDILGRIDF